MLLVACAQLGTGAPAQALLGGQPVKPTHPAADWTVLVENAAGRLCSGALLGPRLVLTAAHCTLGTSPLSIRLGPKPDDDDRRFPVVEVVRHGTFKPNLMPRQQTGVDLALLHLGAAMPASRGFLDVRRDVLPVGELVSLYGFGVAQEGDIASARVLRELNVRHVGTYRHSSGATAQFAQDALVDDLDATELARSACGGDSGGPVVLGNRRRENLVGIMSWSTGPTEASRCGKFSAFVPLAEHAAWLRETAERLAGPQEGALEAPKPAAPILAPAPASPGATAPALAPPAVPPAPRGTGGVPTLSPRSERRPHSGVNMRTAAAGRHMAKLAPQGDGKAVPRQKTLRPRAPAPRVTGTVARREAARPLQLHRPQPPRPVRR
jgi:hypothetical protein